MEKRKQHFIQLTKPWWHRLYNIALQHTGNASTAEDWSQETLLRAWKDFAKLQDDIAIYAWLLTILDRVIIDDKRRSSRRNQIAPVIMVDDEILHMHACSTAGPFNKMMEQSEQGQLQKAIQQLPDDFRRVVLLRDLETFSYKEIAEILDIAQGTVMSRLSRGRRLLASILLKKAPEISENYQIKSSNPKNT